MLSLAASNRPGKITSREKYPPITNDIPKGSIGPVGVYGLITPFGVNALGLKTTASIAKKYLLSCDLRLSSRSLRVCLPGNRFDVAILYQARPGA